MRRILGSRLARGIAIVAGLAATGGGVTGAFAAKTPTLGPGQRLHIEGTRVYCGAKSQSSGVLTTCLVVKTGTQTPEGYAVGIDDKLAGVTQFRGNAAPAVFVRLQPGGATAAPGAAAASGTLTVKVGEKILVAGSNVVLFVSTFQGAPFLAGWVAGKDGQPLDHSYMIGISDRAVNVQQWHAGKTKPVFAKAEPGS